MTNIDNSVVCNGVLKFYTFNMVPSITDVTAKHSVRSG